MNKLLYIFGLIIVLVVTIPVYAQQAAPLPKGESLTPTAVSENRPASEISLLINQLLNDDPELVDEARAEILEIGRPAVPLLIKALKSDKPALRYMVCEILAEIRDERALPHMINLLKDKKEYTASIASVAARALGRLGEPSVIPHLMEAASSPDIELRYEAINALGILRAQEAITLTLQVLTDTAQTFLGYQIRCAALQALGHLKNKTAVPEKLRLIPRVRLSGVMRSNELRFSGAGRTGGRNTRRNMVLP
jgi:HEAT repeat protein